jgi:hypothetical protein
VFSRKEGGSRVTLFFCVFLRDHQDVFAVSRECIRAKSEDRGPYRGFALTEDRVE